MALDSYASLQSSIQQWMGDRTDLASYCADFIALAEAEIGVEMRSRKQVTIADLVLDADSKADLPADYLAYRNVVALTSPRRKLEEVTPGYRDDAWPFRDAGWPVAFSIDNDSILVLPATSYDIEIEYYAKIPALSDSNTTNWVLTLYPTLYLYGAAKQAAIFTDDDARLQKFAQLFDTKLAEAVAAERGALWSNGRARVDGPTP